MNLVGFVECEDDVIEEYGVMFIKFEIIKVFLVEGDDSDVGLVDFGN